MFCMRGGNFSNGVASENPWGYAASSMVRFNDAEAEPGPRPLQAGHAPYGELKLNERGSSCGTEMPQSGQASFSEKTCSLPPTTTTVTRPDASFNAVAMDCSRRAAMPGFTNKRSITISMV